MFLEYISKILIIIVKVFKAKSNSYRQNLSDENNNL